MLDDYTFNFKMSDSEFLYTGLQDRIIRLDGYVGVYSESATYTGGFLIRGDLISRYCIFVNLNDAKVSLFFADKKAYEKAISLLNTLKEE